MNNDAAIDSVPPKRLDSTRSCLSGMVERQRLSVFSCQLAVDREIRPAEEEEEGACGRPGTNKGTRDQDVDENQP